MPWSSLWSSPKKARNENDQPPVQRTEDVVQDTDHITVPTLNQINTEHFPTTSSIWQSFGEPQTIISTVILTAACLGCFRLYRTFLRRIPEATDIHQSYFRRRSILGKVTSVGDGDNFRIYHTPGGWLAGWGWLPWRRVPKDRKLLKGQTIHVRIAGIDAPELAHFGRPSQPFSQEALDWLTSYLMGRRVRAYLHKPDQYSRVVATTYVWKGLLRRDIGLQMLRAGLACVYEAKTGAEFGKGLEQKYRDAERKAKLKRKGMWAHGMKGYESPREYKSKYSNQDQSSKK